LVLFNIVAVIAQFSPLICFFLYFKKNIKKSDLRVCFFYTIASLLSDILVALLANYAYIIISSFTVIEYLFFSAFFYLCLRNKKIKPIIIIASALFLIVAGFLFFFAKTSFDFWAALVSTILVDAYCIFFFYEQLSLPETPMIYKSYQFWITAGCFIYISGILFLYLYTSGMKDKQKSGLWIINIIFEIVKNIFFSIAFLIAKDTEQNTVTEDFDNTNLFKKPF
jgi:hypothetical protein